MPVSVNIQKFQSQLATKQKAESALFGVCRPPFERISDPTEYPDAAEV
jgi:hypothetical protein